ncbi:PA domain-containing protein [Massilia sp. Se16.2.3]|uniref:PA domain-containing protein n=1 Tax=Massilia sp. Se16.2.3 TaxID=2709303 RepID=UPI001E371B34|nr:PA domain-containing protein [Massilia sp. Se16.2.3]
MMFAKSFTTPLRRLATLLLSCAAVASAQAATITIVNQNAPGCRLQRPDPGHAGGRQSRHHARPATPAGLPARGRHLGRHPDQQGADPHRRFLRAAVLHREQRRARLGRRERDLVGLHQRAASRHRYPSALASKLAGTDVSTPGEPHIIARFNSRLGLFPDCLPGPGFYLGFDRNAGAAIDLVTVLLHEMAHGLGFQTFTDDETGAEILGVPSIWDYYLVDNRTERPWVDMTDAERVASAISGNGLSWNGPIVTAAVPQVLDPRSRLTVGGSAAGGAAGNYDVGDASFGPPLGATPVTGQLMPVVEAANALGQACTPLDALNALAVRGNIALVSRGTCPFVDKARNVQAAGAIGMVVADNAPGDPTGMSGADPSITIPSVRVTQAAGASLLGALQSRSRTRSGVVASPGIDPARLAGTDTRRRILMYTPTVNAPGSSVSHYTTEAKPNQLMEPSINSDLTHEVTPPRDLTYPLLQDIGW